MHRILLLAAAATMVIITISGIISRADTLTPPSYAAALCPDGHVALMVALRADQSADDTIGLYKTSKSIYDACENDLIGARNRDNSAAGCSIMSIRAQIDAASIERDRQESKGEQDDLSWAASDVDLTIRILNITDPTIDAWLSSLRELVQRVPDGANVDWSDMHDLYRPTGF